MDSESVPTKLTFFLLTKISTIYTKESENILVFRALYLRAFYCVFFQ